MQELKGTFEAKATPTQPTIDTRDSGTGSCQTNTRSVSLKCKCGSFQGTASDISPASGNRLVCYCDDCQTYAHFLGNANEILDSNGGTDVFSVVPSKLKITHGVENLKCLRLSSKGMFRWYAGCCKTPIANSMPSHKTPFAGVITKIMYVNDQTTHDEFLGPVRGRVQGRYGIGTLPEGTHQEASFAIIFATIKFLFLGWLRGQDQPSPFFSSAGEPIVEPYILTTTERENLRSFCGPK